MNDQRHDTEDNRDYVRVRYKLVIVEVEIEGPADYVDERTAFFLAKFGTGSDSDLVSDAPSLPLNNDSLRLVGEDESKGDGIGTPVPNETNLVTLYRKASPNSQSDQVLILAYWYQILQEREELGVEDFEHGFDQLRVLAVDPPKNIKGAVRNTVDRTSHLYTPERGRFAITIPGIEYVEAMLRGESPDR